MLKKSNLKKDLKQKIFKLKKENNKRFETETN